jgi:hypothetical protein
MDTVSSRIRPLGRVHTRGWLVAFECVGNATVSNGCLLLKVQQGVKRFPNGCLVSCGQLPVHVKTHVLRYAAEVQVTEIAHGFPAANNPLQNNALDLDIAIARNASCVTICSDPVLARSHLPFGR